MAEIAPRKFYISDVKRTMQFLTGMDLTVIPGITATDLTITIKRPDGTSYLMTDTRLILDAVSGLISVLNGATDFNAAGQYFAQIKASAGGITMVSPLMDFYVDAVVT